MIIRSTTLSPPVVLCGGFKSTTDTGPRGFDSSAGGGQVQVAEALRAPAVETYWRGNVNTVVTFRVVRSFADLKAAEVYRATYRNSVEGLKDEWEFRSESADGTTGSCFLIGVVKRAVCGPADRAPNVGLTVEVLYEITGGQFTTVPTLS